MHLFIIYDFFLSAEADQKREQWKTGSETLNASRRTKQ